jgi:DNA-binding LacI/PurR family transcriptional regulator
MPVITREKTEKPIEGKTAQPRYLVLVDELRSQILGNELSVGDRLPSFAEFRLKYGVTPTTTERVYSILEQEGLIERRHGVGTFVAQPKLSLTGNIGLVIHKHHHLHRDPFTARLQNGIQRGIDENRYHLLHMGNDYELNVEATRKIDGALICNIEAAEGIYDQLTPNQPRVSLLIVAPGITSIVPDDYEGGRQAVSSLMAAGHRKIACLMEKQPSIPRRRFTGYYDAMVDEGCEPDESWMRRTATVPKGHVNEHIYLKWGREQMRDWLQNGWAESGCTAIVVQNEVAAIGVMQVLQEEGIKVPDQVSVIGFDGTEMCDLVVPRLTAIELPLDEVGYRGVNILARQIAGEKMAEQVIALPMKLREGDSIAPPPTRKY